MHYIYAAFLFSVFTNILMLTGPLFMLQVYDRVLSSRSEETLAALLILIIGLYGLMWLLDFSRNRLLARYGARFLASLDARVFNAQFVSGNEAATARTSNRDLETIQAFCALPVASSLLDLPFSPAFIGVIFILHPWLGWFALIGGLFLIVLPVLSQFLTAKKVREALRLSEAAHHFAEHARQASEIVRCQGMLAPVTERFVRIRLSALRQQMAAVDWTGAFSTFTRAFRLSLQSLILALGAWLVLQGQITAGAMIAASILLGRALAPLEQTIGRWPQIIQARNAKTALNDFLAKTPEATVRTQLPRPKGELELNGVTVTTNRATPPILYNVTFSLSPGSALGIIGRSGSGKTTIARVILGLTSPSVGQVRLGCALIAHYSARDLGAHVGYLPQAPAFLPGSVAENIARMAINPSSASVVDAARKAMAHELILSLPDGYETRLEDNRIGLSGGQRQRIALARALYGNPVLLVLDEPNSALDQEGSEALNAAIRTMKAQGQSVIVMTHRPVALSECDRLLVLENGHIKALGPRDEIIKSMMKNATEIQRTIVGSSQ